MTSRFNQDGDYDATLPYEMWERSVQNAAGGRKGQKMIAELLIALLEMPERKLSSGLLADPRDGSVCSIGAMVVKRKADEEGLGWKEAQAKIAADAPIHETKYGVDIDQEEECRVTVEWGVKLGFARCLAWQIAYENDETLYGFNPTSRWRRVVEWCVNELTPENFRALVDRLKPKDAETLRAFRPYERVTPR